MTSISTGPSSQIGLDSFYCYGKGISDFASTIFFVAQIQIEIEERDRRASPRFALSIG
jgi:hypothetical protein